MEGEKSLSEVDIMTERWLVSIEGNTQQTLTPAQQKEVRDLARRYLVREGIPIDSVDTMRQAVGVIGDTIQRSLDSAGRTSFRPKEKLRPLVSKGLAVRQQLADEAWDVYNLSARGATTTHLQITGPFALPNSLLIEARGEIQTPNELHGPKPFSLATHLDQSSKLVNLAKQRRGMINQWAAVGISALPAELAGVSIDQFPDIADRAKLVRNMATSWIFKRTLSPLITIADLKDFVKNSDQIPTVLPAAVQTFMTAMHISSEPEKDFIFSLFAQVAKVFEVNPAIPAENDTASVDKFFRTFAKDLLLLHPALEEQQLATRPPEIQAGLPHIWDNCRTIGRFQIPQPEALALALRQAKARRDDTAISRIETALNIWKWFDKMTSSHIARIARHEERLRDRERLLANIADPNFTLPAEAERSAYLASQLVLKSVQIIKKNAEQSREEIERTHQTKQEAQTYKQYLNKTFGEDLPDELPLPQKMALKRAQNRFRRRVGAIATFQRKLGYLERLLQIDFFFAGQNDPADFLKGDDGEKKVKQQLELAASANTAAAAFDQDSIARFLEHLELYSPYRSMDVFGVQQESILYLSFWRDVYNQYKTLDKFSKLSPEEQRQAWDSITQEAQKHRILLFSQALRVMADKQVVLPVLEQAQQDIASIQQEHAASANRTWSRVEAESYIHVAEMSALPDLGDQLPDDFIKTIEEMTDLAQLHHNCLPYEITSKRHLQVSLQVVLETVATEIQQKRFAVKASRFAKEKVHLRNQIQTLQTKVRLATGILKFIDHPLLPTEAPLGREEFIRVWKNRLALARDRGSADKLQTESKLAFEAYDMLLRRDFGERLKKEIESRRTELERLYQLDIPAEFVDKMRTLNLVLAEGTP